MLKNTWIDKVDGVDDVLSEDINNIAHHVIKNEEDIKRGKTNYANSLIGKVIDNPVTFNDLDISQLAHDALCNLESKNVLPYPYRNSTETIFGVTFTDNGDGAITAKGTPTGNCQYDLLNAEIEVFENLILSGSPTGGSAGTYSLQAACRTPAGTYVYPTDFGNGATIIKGYTITRLFIITKPAAGTVDLVFKPQLERGKVATPYTPYMEDFSDIEVAVTTGEGEPTTYTTDENGRVTIPSVTKDTVITSIPDVVIEAEYNVDTNVVPRDYVKKTDYASKDKAGVVKIDPTYGFQVDQNSGIIATVYADENVIAGKSAKFRPITPVNLDYAVKAALSDCRITWTDEEKMAALDLLGVSNLAFRNIQNSGDKLEIPNMVGRYAQITEIHGMDSEYNIYGEYYICVENHPVRLVTDKGDIVFELPSDVKSRLTDFGVRGNYIYFENGKAFYCQKSRVYEPYDMGDGEYDYYNPPLEDGEEVIHRIKDLTVIIKLAAPSITDISDYITTDGIIDIGDAEYITVVPLKTEEDVEAMVNVEDGYYDDYRYGYPITKILVETYGGSL